MPGKLPNKFGPWVTGDEFFDRTAEVNRLTQLLDEKNNILLVAPRRIGKTSLVRETFRRMEGRGKDYLLFGEDRRCFLFVLDRIPRPSRECRHIRASRAPIP